MCFSPRFLIPRGQLRKAGAFAASLTLCRKRWSHLRECVCHGARVQGKQPASCSAGPAGMARCVSARSGKRAVLRERRCARPGCGRCSGARRCPGLPTALHGSREARKAGEGTGFPRKFICLADSKPSIRVFWEVPIDALHHWTSRWAPQLLGLGWVWQQSCVSLLEQFKGYFLGSFPFHYPCQGS